MAIDEHGNHHPDVGTGAQSSWHRPTNRYAGCSCPPFRYSPAHIHKRQTNPDCQVHGETRNA